jgi:hypothetical protein
MRLSCLSIGSRRDGRDYGILPQFRSLVLPQEAGGIIGDFALSLLDWGLEPGPNFALFFSISPQLHLLARVEYLGLQALGPDVLANGVILATSELAELSGLAHRLLAAIPSPSLGPWQQLQLEADVLPPSDILPGDLPSLGSMIRFSPQQVVVEVEEPLRVEQILTSILERQGGHDAPVTWITTTQLKPVERFDPRQVDLALDTVSAGQALHQGTLRVCADGSIRGSVPQSPALRGWHRLFRSNAPPSVKTLLSRQPPPKSRSADEPQAVLVGAMAETMAQADDDQQCWTLLETWAKALQGSGDGDGAAAHMAVAITFRNWLEQLPSPELQAGYLSLYVDRIAPLLTAGPRDLAAALATRLRLFRLLPEPTLAALVGSGLGRNLAHELEVSIRAGELKRRQMAGIAASLLSKEAAEADAERVAAVAEAMFDRELGAIRSSMEGAMPPQIGRLGEHALFRTAERARWRRLAAKMGEAAMLSPTGEGLPTSDRLKEPLRAALAPPNENALRAAWVAVETVRYALKRNRP